MVTTYGTLPWPLTFWQLLLRIFTNIISITLFLMTRLAKMCISPTKPLGGWTTIFTFKLNKVLSMFWTILNRYLAAIWANKFLRLKCTCILWLIHCLSTVLSSTEIRIFTFKALKIGIYCHCIFVRFLEIGRFTVF